VESLGTWGENLAARRLEAAGCRILARNWRTGRLEVDLVIREGGVIAFVEVKTRRPGPQPPAEAVDRRKRLRLRRAAGRWIASRPERATEYRFDVVTVLARTAGPPVVEHVRGAFTADDA
jgi:putative endonuclease